MSKPVDSSVSVFGSRHTWWLCKPLCCRYVFAEFRTLNLPVYAGDVVVSVCWRWALGLFKRDQFDILGAWPAHHSPAHVVDDLRERGIDHLETVAGICVEDWTSKFPDRVSWPTARKDSGTGSPPVGVFGLRRRAALQSAIALSARLQASLERAIKRRAPFADEAAAEAFLVRALEKAEGRFYGAPKPRLHRVSPAGVEA